jgi:threonine dehydrogenase-like Zn-dependent dehydrogenase
MKAVVWHGREDVRVESVPDPSIEEPTDAIVRITSSGICGSDLHLYSTLAMFMEAGDILGHEPMGVVEEVGANVEHVQPGDRVVIPFNISCGHCYMCEQELFAQCETTQNREHGTGASLLGYTKLYGHVAGGQAEYLRVPQAQFGPIKVPDGPPDDRFVYLSDVLPTAWQAVEWADIPEGGSVAVFGLGPIGMMSARIAKARGAETVIGVELVHERLAMAESSGIVTVNSEMGDDVPDALRELTGGRGPDSVIDAVGLEAHGSRLAELMQKATGLLPDRIAEPLARKAGVDRLAALLQSIDAVRRGGTVSIIGVYGGAADPLPMFTIFDKGIQVRLGQAHVKRWIDDLMPFLEDDADPLGTEDFATNRVPLDDAPRMYELFQKKQDGVFKVLLQP